MTIILFGKNGQLGKELDRQARALGLKIFSYSREEIDISDTIKVKAEIEKRKPDILVNASAYHVVPECEKFPEQAFAINAIAVKNLAEICENTQTLLVHYSTDYIFDGEKGSLYRENDTPNPLQVYGISKLAGEHFVKNYTSRSIIIRTCGVYGGKTGSRSKKGNFVLTIIKQAKGKKELEISSEQNVSPTFANDLAKASLQLMQRKGSKGIYHLVNEGYCSWAEFAQKIFEYNGIKTKVIPVDRSGFSGDSHRPLFSALSNRRAGKYGIVLPAWEDAVKRYIRTL